MCCCELEETRIPFSTRTRSIFALQAGASISGGRNILFWVASSNATRVATAIITTTANHIQDDTKHYTQSTCPEYVIGDLSRCCLKHLSSRATTSNNLGVQISLQPESISPDVYAGKGFFSFLHIPTLIEAHPRQPQCRPERGGGCGIAATHSSERRWLHKPQFVSLLT